MKRYPSCILATCVLPWQADFQIDEGLFRRQIRLLRRKLTHHLYLFGTAGEGYGVSDRQFRQIVRTFASEMSGSTDRPMVGVISLSLTTVLQRIEFCLDLGIRDIQISFPCWGSLADREVDAFFVETCGQFPECRFLHYNLPRARRLLIGDDYRRLATAHPNLVAVKDGATDPDGCLAMLRCAPELQVFFTESRYTCVREQAECGLLISVALVNFLKAKEFFAARGETLQGLGAEIDRIHDALVNCGGSVPHMDGAYDKVLIRTHLPGFPLRLLPPYKSLSEPCAEQFISRLPEEWAS